MGNSDGMDAFIEIAKQFGPAVAVAALFIWYVIEQNKGLEVKNKAERDRLDAVNKELVDMIKNDTIATAGQTAATAAHTIAVQGIAAKIDALSARFDSLERRVGP